MDAPAFLAIMALPLAVFGPIDWGIIALYFAVMIYIGVIAARKDQDTREYFLAHRSMPTWAVAISIVATSLSAATFVGVPDGAFAGDISYLTVNIGGILAVFIVATLFIPKLYRAGTVTVYGYLNQRFGEGAMIAVSIMFLLGRMLASGARLFIAAIPLCLLMFAKSNDPAAGQFAATHGQLILAILLIGGVGTFYTAFGGIRTVIWIDVIQFFIVIGAAALTVFILLYKIPLSMPEIFRMLADAPGKGDHSKLFVLNFRLDVDKPFNLWAVIFAYTLTSVAAYGVDQDLAQRFLVAKALGGALSVIWAQLISLGVIAGFLLIGLLLFVFYKIHPSMNRPENQGIYPWFLLNELPTVLSGIAIVGFFAIAQGSMDSAINALASSAVADIYLPLRRMAGLVENPAHEKATPKLAVAAMGIFMSLFGIVCVLLYNPRDRTLIEFALSLMSFAFTGMLGVFLTALLTPRGNTLSVVCALAAGVVSVVMLQPKILAWWSTRLFAHPLHMASTWWMLTGTVISFTVCVIGSPRRAIAPAPF